MDKNTEKILLKYNRFAKIYDMVYGLMEKRMMHKYREMLWREARGKVLEVGVGTGKYK